MLSNAQGLLLMMLGPAVLGARIDYKANVLPTVLLFRPLFHIWKLFEMKHWGTQYCYKHCTLAVRIEVTFV